MKNNIHSHIIRRFLTLGIAIILFSIQAFAQTVGSNLSEWENLRYLPSKQKIRIEKMDGKKMTARIRNAPDGELLIDRKGKSETLRRDDIKQIWMITNNASRKKTGIFAGIGAGAGLFGGVLAAYGIAMSGCDGSCDGEGAAIIAVLVGLPVLGGALGAVLAGKQQETLVYQAP
jgi:hypothetical protein